MTRRSRAQPVARRTEFALLAVAGIAVLATALVRWISRGAGSTFRGLELADALRSNVLVPDAGAVVAVGLYLAVASGGALLASSGFAGRAVALARLGGACAVSAPLLVAAVAGWFPVSRWSWGPSILMAASSIALVVSIVQLRRPAGLRTDPSGGTRRREHR